jgi:hypothetical protein
MVVRMCWKYFFHVEGSTLFSNIRNKNNYIAIIKITNNNDDNA